MPRNAEVIRQWTILRAIEHARGSGVTIDDLASQCAVTTRTIRRDLQALQEPASRSTMTARTMTVAPAGRSTARPFASWSAGLTLSELCALYFSRTLLEALSGTPFRDDLESAFEKLGAGLAPHMKRFLDQLPRVLASKPDPMRKRDDPRQQQLAARLLEATLHLRQASITYHSQSSDRTKDLPRSSLSPGACAGRPVSAGLRARVSAKSAPLRSSASWKSSLLEERFTPIEELPDAAFPHSLGVHSGPPERVEVEFQPAVADYVGSRDWHPSQRTEPVRRRRPPDDAATSASTARCRAGFSASDRSRACSRPTHLAHTIAEQIDEAGAQYRT